MRKTITLLATAVTAVLAGGLLPGPARAAAEGWWHTPGYTVGNSGFNPNERAITTATVKNLKLKNTSLTGSTDLRAPVLDKGRAFVADSTGITAFAESTGERLWRWEYPPTETSSTAQLIVKGQTLISGRQFRIAGSSAPFGSGVVETFDAATGERLATSQSFDGGFSTMLVDRDTVVVSIEENRWDYDTAALRLGDLSFVWGESKYYMGRAVSANGKILIHGYAPADGTQTSQIRDIATGAVVWSGTNVMLWPLAADDAGTKFYVSWGHSLQILDATTGRMKWLASNVYAGDVTVSPTRIYVAHNGGRVSAFDALTDKPVFWSRTFPTAALKPIVAGGVLYVTIPGDRIHVLDPVTGATIATTALTGATRTPVVTNGTLYLTDGTRLRTYGL